MMLVLGDSLRSITTRYVAKRIDVFKEDLELLPTPVKNDLIRVVTRTCGFKNEDAFCSLLNPTIMIMNLGSSTITDKMLNGIATRCPKIEGLWFLSGTYKFTSEGLKAVAKMHKLKSLNMETVDVLNDQIVDLICKGCPDLEELNLNRCKNLTDACGLSLNTLALRRLDMAENRVGNEFIFHLVQPTGRMLEVLMELNIKRTMVRQEGLHATELFPDLRTLGVSCLYQPIKKRDKDFVYLSYELF